MVMGNDDECDALLVVQAPHQPDQVAGGLRIDGTLTTSLGLVALTPGTWLLMAASHSAASNGSKGWNSGLVCMTKSRKR